MSETQQAKKPDPKKSDLGVRFVSAIVMIAIAGGALWAGGWIFTAFVGLIAIGLLWEWWGLVRKLSVGSIVQALTLIIGGLYILTSCYGLVQMIDSPSHIMPGIVVILVIIAAVIATDVGAYFAGRAIGGPKIAPSISPSKTWAGLGGGMLATALLLSGTFLLLERAMTMEVLFIGLMGAILAVIAQAGDFLESFIKRKAGVKDSGNLIPGHGGLLDRMDGMLAVFFVFTLLVMASGGFGDPADMQDFHEAVEQPL